MEMELINVLSNYGFPVFVTLWFMFRTEKIINKNTEAINKMNEIITKLCEGKK